MFKISYCTCSQTENLISKKGDISHLKINNLKILLFEPTFSEQRDKELHQINTIKQITAKIMSY